MIISYRYMKWCELCLVWMNWKLVKTQYVKMNKFMNKSVSDQMEPLCFQYSSLQILHDFINCNVSFVHFEISSSICKYCIFFSSLLLFSQRCVFCVNI